MGLNELVLLGVFGLILFGPEELPKVARSIGRVAYDIKKVLSDVQNEVHKTVFDEHEQSAKPTSAQVDQFVDEGVERKG